MDKQFTWAIIGGGNGGQSVAGHLALLGQRVRLFDVVPKTVGAISAKGGIEVSGAVQGFGKLEFATDDMARAVTGADIVMVTLPSIYHADIAGKFAPCLRDGQLIFLHPEASCGALALRKNLADLGCRADVTIAAANTLLYTCRAAEPGRAHIYGIKEEVLCAALPASRNHILSETVCAVLDHFKVTENVLHTSLANLNALMHPAPMLLGTARVESGEDYQYYLEGITPSIGAYIERMDREFIEIGKAYGLALDTINHKYSVDYRCGKPDEPLWRLCRDNPAYVGVLAPKTLRCRYVLEDVPYSLVPVRALAAAAGVGTPCVDAIIALGQNMLAGEIDEGRTAEKIGIAGMDAAAVRKLVTG